MKRKFFCIAALFVLFTMLNINALAQDYSVAGGSGTPLLAVDNSNYRIKVFMLFGLQDAKISYTSESSSHKWYRFRTKVDELNPEPVASTQNGTTSYITDIEDGCGYYVDENGAMRRYIWIIDYSRHVFDVRQAGIAPDVDPCIAFRLIGEATMDDMAYYTPGGTMTPIPREFEVIYNTLEWQAELNTFTEKTYTEKFTGDPFDRSFSHLPLTDTEITLHGDIFAQHFGVDKSISTPLYEAKALEVHADTLILYSGSGNANGGATDSELAAPVTIRFRAVANKPTASLFVWKIVNAEQLDKPLINFTGEEVEYTFEHAGSYSAYLEVSDRSGTCSNTDYSFDVNITETVMEIPNAFSPGITPGVNDIFRVKYRSVIRFQGWIYNRWGNQLFHWTDPSQGWDGKYNGKYVPAGAYYYMIEYVGTDGKKHVRRGDVNVFRSSRIDLKETNNQ
jgi:gliding motility-associated-like protein